MQSEAYATALFGVSPGYVATAIKRGPTSWEEQVWEWPEDREAMLTWAAKAKGDVFVCPAIRRNRGRIKGDGAHLQWLWADVDYQDVPADQREVVAARVAKMATIVINSGSGDNVHVYVRLTKQVSLDVWRRLNLGLRVYLMADAKHTDNALLRLPGTLNHKDGAGAVAFARPPGTKRAKPSVLLAHPVWQGVVVTDDDDGSDGSFEVVDVTGIMRGRVKAMVSMPVDEARGRYGTRHGAVFQVATWLSKRGFTGDQVHSLMATFPAGLDKELTERGYSLHQDIGRCLAQQPTVDVLRVEGVETLEEVGDGDDDGTSDADDRMVKKALVRLEQWNVDDLAKQMQAQRRFSAPPANTSERLSDAVVRERPPTRYAVEGIAAWGDNVTITGQYKAGKTLLGVNLVRSLADGVPFLDEYKVDGDLGGDIGLWSCEMNADALYDDYFIPQGVDRPDGVVVWHGRGYGVSLLTDVGMAWTVNWLRDNGCRVWVIDSWARVCRMAGVEENDNGAALDLLHRIDQIKLDAGVHTSFMLLHTGRGEQTEGRERARGATVLDDWADTRWVYTRDGDVRFLAVEGRSVRDMPATSLVMDRDTKRLTLGGRDRMGARVDGLVQVIVSAVREMDGGYNKRALIRVVRERLGGAGKGQNDIADAIAEAVECGFIEVRPHTGRENRYWTVTGTVTGDGHSSHGSGATARVLDFSRVKEGKSRRKRRVDSDENDED